MARNKLSAPESQWKGETLERSRQHRGEGEPAVSGKRRSGFPIWTTSFLLLAVLLYGWLSWHRFNAYYLRKIDTETDLRQLQQREEIAAFIAGQTPEDECIIIDDVALAVTAERWPAPPLVGLSDLWLKGGLMTDRELAALILDQGCRTIVLSKREYHLYFSDDIGSWIAANFPNEEAFMSTRIHTQ